MIVGDAIVGTGGLNEGAKVGLLSRVRYDASKRPTERRENSRRRVLLTFDGRFSRLFARQDLPTAGN